MVGSKRKVLDLIRDIEIPRLNPTVAEPIGGRVYGSLPEFAVVIFGARNGQEKGKVSQLTERSASHHEICFVCNSIHLWLGIRRLATAWS